MMKKSIFTEFIKILIDAFFKPLKKNKTFLSYIFNHTFQKELEERIENGGIFPLHHISRSIRLAKQFPDQNFTILDIGGGVGATVLLYNKFFPDNKIIVFEPILENFDLIKSKVISFANIEVYNLAVGNENSKKQINIANRITSSSLFPLSGDPSSSVFNEKNLGQCRVENIEEIRLDDFLTNSTEDIGIIKIDVQGYEMNVLKGAEATMKRAKIILLELNNHDGYVGSPKYYEIDNYLRDHHFQLYDILPSILEKGKLKEWDAMYLNSSAICELG
jgi:FkbM family methyltransferase